MLSVKCSVNFFVNLCGSDEIKINVFNLIWTSFLVFKIWCLPYLLILILRVKSKPKGNVGNKIKWKFNGYKKIIDLIGVETGLTL